MRFLTRLLELTTAPRPMPVNNKVPNASLLLRTSLVHVDAETPVLRVEYFTPTLGGSSGLSQSLLSSYDTIPNHVSHRHAVEQPEHALSDILEHQLRGNPTFKKMHANLKGANGLKLSNILAKVEASKDLPEQPQPAGLTQGITLHDYQRCVLTCRRVFHVRGSVPCAVGIADCWCTLSEVHLVRQQVGAIVCMKSVCGC